MDKKDREKNKDYAKVSKQLFSYIMKEWKLFTLSLVLAIASNLVLLSIPKLLGESIDTLTEVPINFSNTYTKVFIMLGVYVAASIVTYISTITMIKVSQKIIVKLRQDTFDKIVDVPIKYIDGNQTGDLVSRISYDLDVVNENIRNNIIEILSSLITVVGSFVMMLSISINLSLIFLLILPITIIFTIYRIRSTRPL